MKRAFSVSTMAMTNALLIRPFVPVMTGLPIHHCYGKLLPHARSHDFARVQRGEIVPSVKGLATIYDKDILIDCISQLTLIFPNAHMHLGHRGIFRLASDFWPADGCSAGCGCACVAVTI